MFRTAQRKIAVAGLVCTAGAAMVWGEGKPAAVIVSGSEAKWEREAKDAPGTESVMLRMDAASGGMELLVRFPAGHVFKPHWHESNERIVVLEGRLAVGPEGKQQQVEAGGYAFLPAREVQYLACSSKTRCSFYLGWDGNPASHSGPVK